MADDAAPAKEDEKKLVHTYPLVRFSDMVEDMKNDTVEVVVTACEKHANNNESAAKFIKESLDKKYGPPWHAVVGEGFGYDVSYEIKNLLYMFFSGNLAICVWKCS